MYSSLRVALQPTLLLLLALRQEGALASHMIETCAGLKQAIETAAAPAAAARGGADADGAVLTLRLSGEAPYLCEERILVGEGRTVEIVGGGPPSNVLVFQPKNPNPAALPPTSRRSSSLFVNEGTLRLSNISFHLNAAGGGEAAAAGGGRGGGEEGGYCAGAGLVRNSGHLLLESVEVLESRRAFSPLRCRVGEAGRVVSGQKEYIRVLRLSDEGFRVGIGWAVSQPRGG